MRLPSTSSRFEAESVGVISNGGRESGAVGDACGVMVIAGPRRTKMVGASDELPAPVPALVPAL